ncbi:MAG: aldo/keto reductase family oxidoreductase [Phormidium sp. OSCR]|nr:MAG: aldo/keto reductase family oxidoreductase [Phormidium sp. OSCR]
MQYRRFGRTNLQLSVFSLGTMRYLASEETAIATVRKAVCAGINHIETARGYGNSEAYLGRALQLGLGCPREALHITSKLPPTPDGQQLEQWLDESLDRLGCDYLDTLAIHGLNTPQQLASIQGENGSLAAAERARKAGKIRHLGFSTHGDLDLILEAMRTGAFEFVNLHYYLFFQRHQPAIALADALDMGVFIISPADKGGQLHHPPKRLRELCKPLSPLGLNYRFLLSDPRVSTLSVGPATPEELDGVLAWGDRLDPLTATERDGLGRLEQEFEQRLGSDACRQCYACLPCPEQIQIPEVLRLRNLAIAYEMESFGQYRYRMFENAGHWFPGRRGNRCTDCGDCLPRCPEQLDIPRLLRDTHARLAPREGRRLWQED